MAYLKLRVTPGAREDSIVGWLGDRSADSGQVVLRVKVRAAPERGKANEAVCRLIAAKLGLAASLVTIANGGSSREKLLFVEGLTDEELRTRLQGPIL